jgi:hypothetical protein
MRLLSLMFTPKGLRNIAQRLPPMLAATLGYDCNIEFNPEGVAAGVANVIATTPLGLDFVCGNVT